MASNEEAGLIRDQRNSISNNWLTVLGYAAFLANLVLSTTASACAQALGGYVPGNQRNLLRYVAQFVCIVPVVAVKKLDIRITSKQNLFYLAIICLTYPAYLWLYYGADTYIPTSSVGCIQATTLIVCSTVVSVLVLREFECYMWAAVLLCVAGVTMVTQPSFIFTSNEPTVIHPLCGLSDRTENQTVIQGHTENITSGTNNSSNLTNVTISGRLEDAELGYIYTISSGILYLVFILSINKRLKEVDSFVVTFWLAASGMLLSLIGMAIFETPMIPSDKVCLGILVAHAVSAGCSSVFLVWSIGLLPPRVCAIIAAFEVVLMCTAQYTVLRNINKGHGNAIEIIGVVVVLLGNMVRPVRQIIAHIYGKDDYEENTD